ncbi:MAG TPA: NADPH-dependent FMN reductase [Methyloradius sp.]
MSQYQIGVFVGSLRKDSINRKLANAIVKLGPTEFRFNFIDISQLPLYDQDDDANPAPSVQQLRNEIKAAQGLIFVTPEYNRSISGVLKNAIDHGSRPRGQSAFPGIPAAIIGASPAFTGTAMAQQHLRNILASLDIPVMAMPEAFIHVDEYFYDQDDNVVNVDTKRFLQKWMSAYVTWFKNNTG